MDTLVKTSTHIIFKVQNQKQKCCIFNLKDVKKICPESEECKCYANVKVTIKDIIKYKAVDCKQLAAEKINKSGEFYLAGFLGSWEIIDTLVEKALEHFRKVDAKRLTEAGQKYGIKL